MIPFLRKFMYKTKNQKTKSKAFEKPIEYVSFETKLDTSEATQRQSEVLSIIDEMFILKRRKDKNSAALLEVIYDAA